VTFQRFPFNVLAFHAGGRLSTSWAHLSSGFVQHCSYNALTASGCLHNVADGRTGFVRFSKFLSEFGAVGASDRDAFCDARQPVIVFSCERL
jgi:hypothetical protein